MSTAFVLMLLVSMLFISLPLVLADYTVDHASFPPDLPGDVTYDGKVDIRDISLVGKSFGSSFAGGGYWNARCDVNDDGKVDIKDVSAVSKLFGVVYTTSATPVAYSTSFKFDVPYDGEAAVWYYMLVRFYVPTASQYDFSLRVDVLDDWVINVKVDCQLKYGGSTSDPPCVPKDITLGSLSQGYHLLEFNFVEKWGGGAIRFSIANTNGDTAWLDRFRKYVPNYSDTKYEYTVRTTTNFTIYDLYYFTGFADDYICNFKVDSTQWYEWQWNTSQGIIPAWQDGFLYPVFNSKENGQFAIEFTFGNVAGGLLDFQFVSLEMQKSKTGRPKFYTETALTPEEASVEAVLQKAWIYGGSSWCDINAVETGDPTNFGFITQGIRVMANGTIVNPDPYREWFGLEYPQEAKLSISAGFLKLDPRENDYIDIGIFFNLTSGNLYHSYYEGNETADPLTYADNPVSFKPENIEIWTPYGLTINQPSALVYNDTSSISFISPQFKVVAPFASTTTTGLLAYAFSGLSGGLVAGPFGVVVAGLSGFGMYQFFNFLGNQQIVTSHEDQGNSTYRMLHSDRFNVAGDMEVSVGLPNNSTQALFIRLKAAQRYNCGSIKIRIEGTLGVSYWCWFHDVGFGTYAYLPIKVETTFILPIFIRD